MRKDADGLPLLANDETMGNRLAVAAAAAKKCIALVTSASRINLHLIRLGLLCCRGKPHIYISYKYYHSNLNARPRGANIFMKNLVFIVRPG